MEERPKSAPKTMEIINPRGKAVEKPKKVPPKKKPLEKVQTRSMSSSSTGFREVKELREDEKQRLELLTGPSLTSSLRLDSDLLQQREETQRRLQAILNKSSEDSIESFQTSLEISKKIGEEVKDKEKKAKEINRFIDYLKTHTDNEGNKVIEYPDNFEEIVETAIGSSKLPGGDKIKWIEFYENKKHDKKYQKDMKRIKKLDREIARHEKTNSADTSVFVTGVAHSSNKSQSEFSRKSNYADKIQRNIETAGHYQGHYSLIGRLGNKDKARLDFLVENKAIKEHDGMLTGEDREALQEIDQKLKDKIPAIEWETRSADLETMSTATHVTSKVLEVREETERREVFQRLKKINSELASLQREPTHVPTEEEIQKLVGEIEYEPKKAIKYEVDPLIENAKNLILSIENDSQINPNKLLELYDDVERIENEYEKLALEEEDKLEKSEVFQDIKKQLENLHKDCTESELEISETMRKIDQIDEKLAESAKMMDRFEELEKNFEPEFEANEKDLPSIEDIDKEIEDKVMESYVPPEADFSCLDDITPENFPMLYHIYQNMIQDE